MLLVRVITLVLVLVDKKNMCKKAVDSLATLVALKALCNGILKLMGSQVTTEISGYKEVELCMGGRGVL